MIQLLENIYLLLSILKITASIWIYNVHVQVNSLYPTQNITLAQH
jgi:hypothetical protein